MSKSSQFQQPTYSIGVVSRLTGISVHTLRMWERRYGLGASKRSSGGQRAFTRVDMDHLSLIKQLVDEGMRIGDIAKLPRKTLSGVCEKQYRQKIDKAGATQLISIVVLGYFFSTLLRAHEKRFPQLLIEYPAVGIEQWLSTDALNSKAEAFFLQIDTLNRSHINQLQALKHANKSIFLHYQFAAPAVLQELTDLDIKLVRGSLDINRVDLLVKQVEKQQQRMSRLSESMQNFDIPVAIGKPHYFDQQQLQQAAQRKSELGCECPSHLVEIIHSLMAFEQYSQQCEVDNWQDAAVHACVYSYTTQARLLMEKALAAVLDS